MENAVGALKIAFAVLIFMIGLATLFSMTTQARETASFLISETDPTIHYLYYEEPTEDIIDNNGNRIVTLQDIIPVLYRYSEENYGVTIIDKDGNITARFDLDTETACNNWVNASDYTKYKFITEVAKSSTRKFPNIGMIHLYCSTADIYYHGMFIPDIENLDEIYLKIKKIINV